MIWRKKRGATFCRGTTEDLHWLASYRLPENQARTNPCYTRAIATQMVTQPFEHGKRVRKAMNRGKTAVGTTASGVQYTTKYKLVVVVSLKSAAALTGGGEKLSVVQ
jgi:hypothetical protein